MLGLSFLEEFSPLTPGVVGDGINASVLVLEEFSVERRPCEVEENHILIQDDEGSSFYQAVKYDWRPKHCQSCKLFGHSTLSSSFVESNLPSQTAPMKVWRKVLREDVLAVPSRKEPRSPKGAGSICHILVESHLPTVEAVQGEKISGMEDQSVNALRWNQKVASLC
ncbi:hypothetical protein NE237_008747 [Protea cynaroides]|uniref:Uncharacterized protein n=1 Tax=Protea cynaroides TaxID=273540 RepID=A0A9Q0QZZ4_9MAGN|nr:hypothetical protein NE237_008747 [Protea cynaroides]